MHTSSLLKSSLLKNYQLISCSAPGALRQVKLQQVLLWALLQHLAPADPFGAGTAPAAGAAPAPAAPGPIPAAPAPASSFWSSS